jgi:hypothetical protein
LNWLLPNRNVTQLIEEKKPMETLAYLQLSQEQESSESKELTLDGLKFSGKLTGTLLGAAGAAFAVSIATSAPAQAYHGGYGDDCYDYDYGCGGYDVGYDYGCYDSGCGGYDVGYDYGCYDYGCGGYGGGHKVSYDYGCYDYGCGGYGGGHKVSYDYGCYDYGCGGYDVGYDHGCYDYGCGHEISYDYGCYDYGCGGYGGHEISYDYGCYDYGCGGYDVGYDHGCYDYGCGGYDVGYDYGCHDYGCGGGHPVAYGYGHGGYGGGCDDYCGVSQGYSVYDIQVALNYAGFPVHVDGVFGPQTEAAVLAFQASCGLIPDGIVGPATAHALGLY